MTYRTLAAAALLLLLAAACRDTPISPTVTPSASGTPGTANVAPPATPPAHPAAPMTATPTATPSLAPSLRRVLAPIEAASVRRVASTPAQYILDVTSGLPNGCQHFDHYDVTHSGDEFVVSVWNTTPTDPRQACTMLYGYVEHHVSLGTDLTPGRTYTVRINDRTRTFVVTGG